MPIAPEDLTGITVVRTPAQVAIPASSPSGPDWTDLVGRVVVLEGRDLATTPGVDLTGITDGQSLAYDAASGDMVPANLPQALDITYFGSPNTEDVRAIEFNYGLSVVSDEPFPGVPRASVSLNFGGTGSATTPARSDHSHTGVLPLVTGIAATGVLSSGTRTLYSGNLGPLLAGITYDIEATFVVMGRNNGDNGEVTLAGRVGTSGTYPARTRTVPTVGGVPVDLSVAFAADLAGAGATVPVTFTAQFASGSGTDLLTGEVRVYARPRR